MRFMQGFESHHRHHARKSWNHKGSGIFLCFAIVSTLLIIPYPITAHQKNHVQKRTCRLFLHMNLHIAKKPESCNRLPGFAYPLQQLTIKLRPRCPATVLSPFQHSCGFPVPAALSKQLDGQMSLFSGRLDAAQ